MAGKTTVLVIGVTGTLGFKIALAILTNI